MKNLTLLLLTLLVAIGCDQTATRDTTAFDQLNAPIRFDLYAPTDIDSALINAKANLDPDIEAILSIPVEERTFDNTIQAYDNMADDFGREYGVVYLLGSTHPDSAVRETALKTRAEFAKVYNEKVSLNEDLYKAVKEYSQTEEATTLTGYKKKFVEDLIIGFERNGFDLPEDEQEQLKNLLNEITEISNEFQRNIATYQDFLVLNEKQMEGLPEDFKKSHLQEDGTYKVGLSYPDYRPFMKNAVSSEARKQLYIKYTNRAADKNIEVLDRLLAKRNEMVNLLGYKTYGDYQTEVRMVKNPETVWDFETSLTEKLMPKAKADYQELLDFQKSMGIESNEIASWDFSYLTEELKANEYGVDEEEVRQFFPLENVKKGLFSITQNLFGVTYKKMDNAFAWHEDVTGYDVYDGDQLIGRFYLDLHPRPNKYSHAACFPIISSKQRKEAYQIPVASLVCNFTEPTEDKPALMTHDEVNTFFHEFGHVLHNMLSKTTLGSQAGTSVARDFVEAPSQIFENWAWNYESLKLFARHYETNDTLPKELFDKMLAAKNVMSGLLKLRQVFYGTYDMTLHNRYIPGGEKTTTDVLSELQGPITLFDHVPGTYFQAAFGHLTGYAASYYGYLWSEVYAQDMFSRFEEEGIMNPETGKDYREKILSRGGEMDEMEMLVDFLGRQPNDDAFVKSIGLEN